ncbi:hypothetical protein [Dyadobacter sandarakinus]|uniref:hypothetical protein n=1 Tax=Dyadobacter sandarakinus TaxID=2747268 RepID=UPI001E2A5BD4|nr:hypothetical protein [Dyadobacter sandarakinus]
MASMLEYIKIILQKVSFDRRLFEKELRKAIRMLMPAEVTRLRQWCYDNYSAVHLHVLNSCFARLTPSS